MSSLTPLEDDKDRYRDVYLNGFSKIAMKDVVLKKVTQYFDDNVMKRLTDAFSQDDQFNLLGVGVGEGQHELHFLQSLESHFTSISNVAVDLNESLLGTFKSNAAAWNSDDKSKHVSHWFTGPLSQFIDDSPLAKSKYNLISAIHSMYHTGDLETTINRLASMLKEKGVMIIVLSDCSLLRQTLLQTTWIGANYCVNEKSFPERIHKVAQQKGYTVTMLDLDIKWDFTELFDDKSKLGDRLIDFMTTVAYFRKTAPTGKLDELMSCWRSFCPEDKDGRMCTEAGETLFLIST